MEFVETVKIGLKSKPHTGILMSGLLMKKTKRAREGESEVKNVKKRNIKLERMCGESE